VVAGRRQLRHGGVIISNNNKANRRSSN
jgi:hypothetical protein